MCVDVKAHGLSKGKGLEELFVMAKCCQVGFLREERGVFNLESPQ